MISKDSRFLSPIQSRLAKTLRVAGLIGTTLPAIANLGRGGDATSPLLLAQAGTTTTAPLERPTPARAAFQQVSSVTNMPTVWNPAHNLYIKGDVSKLNMDFKRAGELAAWLKANHPNWTVYLSADSSKEVYVDSAGKRYTGHDAVRQCLGKALPTRSDFTSRTDPRDGRKNGAIWFLSMDAGRCAINSSPQMEELGLGNDKWVDNLDKPAMANLRKGRRVAPAVEDSIANIDSLVTAAIETAAKNAEMEKERAANAAAALAQNATQGVTTAKAELLRFEELLSTTRQRHPQAEGAILYPDLTKTKAALVDAEALLQNRDFSGALSKASSAHGSVNGFRKSVEEYNDLLAALPTLEKGLAQLTIHPRAKAHAKELDAARTVVNSATQSYSVARADYREKFTAASQQIQQLHAVMDAEVRSARNGRIALGTIATFGVLGTLGVGGIMMSRAGRRRRHAESLLSDWKKLMSERIEGWMGFRESQSDLVGAYAEKRVFTGATALAAQALREDARLLGEIQVELGQRLTRVEQLLKPGFANMFLQRNYDQAIGLLSKTPESIAASSTIATAATGKVRASDKLTATRDSVKDVGVNFEQLDQLFLSIATRAQSNFKKIDEAVYGSSSQIAELDKELAKIPVLLGHGTTQTVHATFASRLADIRSTAVSDPLAAKGEADKLKSTVTHLLELTETASTLETTTLPELEKRVAILRHEIATTLVISPSEVLNEKGCTPDKTLKEARESLRRVKAWIGSNHIAEAEKTLEETATAIEGVAKLHRTTSEAFHVFTSAHTAEEARTAKILESQKEARQILTSMIQTFDPAVMLLGTADATHPRKNDTVTDNLEESKTAMLDAQVRAKEAKTLFNQGNILQAAFELSKTKELNQFAEDRISEIREKADRLHRVSMENSSILARHTADLEKLRAQKGNPQVMAKTVTRIGEMEKALAAIETEMAKPRSNPFTIEEQLKSFAKDLKTAQERVAYDLERYEEAERSLKQAKRDLDAAELQLAGQLATPLNFNMQKAQDNLSALRKRFVAANREFSNDEGHGDWSALDKEADEIAREVGIQKSRITMEQEMARQASEKISSATAKIAEIRKWNRNHSSFKVRASEQGTFAGEDALDTARSMFARGSYSEALGHATTSLKSAAGALGLVAGALAAHEREAAEQAAQRAIERANRERSYSSRTSRWQDNDNSGGEVLGSIISAAADAVTSISSGDDSGCSPDSHF